MSGRPADPSYVVITWDTGNYPAGSNPWNATAKRTDPTYRSYTPGTLIAPQYQNFFLGAGFDVDAAAKTYLTSLAHLVGQNPALNWLPKTASSGTKNCNRGAWSTVDQAWFIVGNGGTDFAAVSFDYGRTWADLATASTTALVDVAVDASGNVVFIATGTRSTTKCTRTGYATYTFATTANALSVAPSGGSLSYDSLNATFIACYRNGATGMKVDTSTNGTVWTARAIPATWTAYTGTAQSPHITSNAAGTTIACFFDDVAGVLRFARSTNGGTSWADVQDSSPGMSATAQLVVRPTYDDVNGVWYVGISTDFTGTRQAQIWKSTNDGVTWTSAPLFSANDIVIHGLVALGALLVLSDDRGRIAFSADGSTTWKWCGRNPQTTAGTDVTPLGLRGGGGGLLLLNAPDRVAYASMRFGDDGQAV